MDRLQIAVSVILLIALMSGCAPQSATNQANKGPEDISMARHICTAHGVWIDGEAPADIIVKKTNDMISIHLSTDFLKRTPSDCLPILRFQQPDKIVSKSEYRQFLDQLHAYLLLTPIQSNPQL